MASLYKERSKCLVKLPTMQYTVTDTGKEDGEKGVNTRWGKLGLQEVGRAGLKSRGTA